MLHTITKLSYSTLLNTIGLLITAKIVLFLQPCFHSNTYVQQYPSVIFIIHHKSLKVVR